MLAHAFWASNGVRRHSDVALPSGLLVMNCAVGADDTLAYSINQGHFLDPPMKPWIGKGLETR